jgi:hypothetical protein
MATLRPIPFIRSSLRRWLAAEAWNVPVSTAQSKGRGNAPRPVVVVMAVDRVVMAPDRGVVTALHHGVGMALDRGVRICD